VDEHLRMYATALADYEGGSVDSGLLPLQQGSTIELLSIDGEWMYGSCNGRQGYFPASFCKM
jgi:hypothetical protein